MKITRRQLRRVIKEEIGLVTESAAPPSPDLLSQQTGLAVADVELILNAIDAEYEITHKADATHRDKRWAKEVAELKQIIISLGGTPPLSVRSP